MTAGDERMAAAARFTGGGGSPVAGDGKGKVAELPLTTAHPTVVTATGDDDGDGGAAAPEMAGGGGGVEHVAAALRGTGDHGRGGKRKRRTRGSYLKPWIEEIRLQTRGIEAGKSKTRFWR